jgi:hypothetical protein
MARMCCNRACPALLPAQATHRVVSPLTQPGVWNILGFPGGQAYEQPEFCLSCAMTVAQQRKEAWQKHQKEMPHGS